MIHCKVIVAIGISMLFISGCGGRTAIWDLREEPLERDIALLDEASLLRNEGENFWKERLSQEMVNDAIVRWEQALSIDPFDYSSLIGLGKGYGILALWYLADADEKTKAALKGLDASERALMNISPEFTEKMRKGAAFDEGVAILTEEALDALYWYAVNLDLWLQDQSGYVKKNNEDKVLIAINRILEIDETHSCAAAHRFLGVWHAEKAADYEKAGEHLRRAVELAPDYLESRVLLAEKVALPLNNQDLFKKQISYVLEADPDPDSDYLPENARARLMARKLASEIDLN